MTTRYSYDTERHLRIATQMENLATTSADEGLMSDAFDGIARALHHLDAADANDEVSGLDGTHIYDHTHGVRDALKPLIARATAGLTPGG